MKHLLFLFILIVFSAEASAQEAMTFSLSCVGKPDHRKITDTDQGLVVYKRGSESFATILPRDYFVLGRYNDTLDLLIKKDKKSASGYLTTCSNCTNIQFRETTENGVNYFTLSAGEDFVKFIVTFEKELKGMHVAPNDEHFQRDTETGYIRLQNTLTHFGAVPAVAGVNLAIVDMNHNGRADSSDFLSLSRDAYFYSAERDRSQLIQLVETIAINDQLYYFTLVNPKTFEVKLTPTKSSRKPDLMMQDLLPDLQLGEKKLYTILDSAKIVVIFHWTEFSQPSMLTVPELNDLSETVTIIGLHSGRGDLAFLTDRYSMDFYNAQCTEELENKLNLGGYPNYLVIDESKTILLQTNNVDELVRYVQGDVKTSGR